MGGTLVGCDSWFNNPKAEVSAHVGIGLGGSIHEYVHEEDTAWANGRLETDNTWPGTLRTGINSQTLSAETEDLNNPNQEVTPEQLAAATTWVIAMKERHPTLKWLLGHNVISPHSRANCPGARWWQHMQTLADAAGLELMV